MPFITPTPFMLGPMRVFGVLLQQTQYIEMTNFEGVVSVSVFGCGLVYCNCIGGESTGPA